VKSNDVSGKKCVVGVIYRHPSPNSQAFQLAFTNLLEIMHSEKSNYIIGGDLNLIFLKYQIDTHITDYVNSTLSLCFISLINKSTSFSSTCQHSLLDHIYTNIIDDNTTTGIARYDISDHLPIFANFNFHPKCAKKYRPKFSVYKILTCHLFWKILTLLFLILTFTTKTTAIPTSLVTILFLCLTTFLANMLPLGLFPEKKLVHSTNLG